VAFGSKTINVPAERRIDESRLEIRYSPSLAMAMVDALEASAVPWVLSGSSIRTTWFGECTANPPAAGRHGRRLAPERGR
jgi:hypothetical protein